MESWKFRAINLRIKIREVELELKKHVTQLTADIFTMSNDKESDD